MTNDTNACRDEFERISGDYHQGKFERTNLGDYINASVQDSWVFFADGRQARAKQDKAALRQAVLNLLEKTYKRAFVAGGLNEPDKQEICWRVAKLDMKPTLDKLLGETE